MIKYIISLIIVSIVSIVSINAFAQDVINGGWYSISNSPSLKYTFISKKCESSNTLSVGFTYSLKDEIFESYTDKTQNAIFLYSNGVKCKQFPVSTLGVTSFFQTVESTNSIPLKLNPVSSTLALSLMSGEIDISVPTNKDTNSYIVTLQTQLSDISLMGGKYKIKSSDKFNIVYIVEGSVVVHDKDKNLEYASGKMVLILPDPIKQFNTMITEKNLTSDDLKSIGDLNESTKSSFDVLFTLIDGKVVGIKMN